MGLKCFFHKIKIGFVRRRTPSIPYTSSAKKFGNQGESEFFDMLVDSLPECRIKKNIIIEKSVCRGDAYVKRRTSEADG